MVDEENFTFNNDKTYGHLGLKDWFITYSQELNNSCIEFDMCLNAEKRIHLKEFIKRYRKMYYTMSSKKILSKASKEDQKFLRYYYKNNLKIRSSKTINRINDIVREVLEEWGIYDITASSEDYR